MTQNESAVAVRPETKSDQSARGSVSQKAGTVARSTSAESHQLLIALITYLALSGSRSRTSSGLAEDLGLPRDRVAATLDGYPAFFRRSRRLSERRNEVAYTLHARFAMRSDESTGASDDSARSLPLSADVLKTLLSSAQALRDETVRRWERHVTSWMAVLVAVVAACAAVASTFLKR
jgi:hypothetical protein